MKTPRNWRTVKDEFTGEKYPIYENGTTKKKVRGYMTVRTGITPGGRAYRSTRISKKAPPSIALKFADKKDTKLYGHYDSRFNRPDGKETYSKITIGNHAIKKRGSMRGGGDFIKKGPTKPAKRKVKFDESMLVKKENIYNGNRY